MIPMRMTAPGGWVVEVISVTVYIGEREVPVTQLRVRQHGYIVPDCRTPADVARVMGPDAFASLTEEGTTDSE